MVEKNKQVEEFRYTILVVAGSLLIAVFLLFLIGRPLYNSVKSTGKELKAEKEKLSRLETKLETLKVLDSRKEELQKKNEIVLAAIPTDKDISRLFYQFEKVALSSGVTIESVRETTDVTNTETDGSSSIVTPVSYQVSARANSYSNFKQALDNFETSLRILSIDKINVSGDPGELNISLTINTYKRG